LLIRGISGLGKTFVPRCLENNELKPLAMFSMVAITEAVKEGGEFDLQTSKHIYLDDVGTEQTVINHFGTKITLFKDFIELYYSKNLPFNRLLISTNCNSNQLEEKYGFRVRSRAREMFNVIDVRGNDMRQ
jgi:DNA replication protein DnaC